MVSVSAFIWNGKELKFRRLKAGLTAFSLAEAVNRSPASIYHRESNFSYPSTKAILRLANVLGCNPGVFFVATEPRSRRIARQKTDQERVSA
jgi:transcriptional regulator with XRE-family HTH domain